jgi:hypothetical protein
VAGVDTPDIAFTSATPVYTFTRSLGQTYKNVKYLRASLSTWNSKSKYFGFDTAISYSSDPISQFTFDLIVFPNNSFIKLGFNIVLVCENFDLIVDLYGFNMTQINFNYSMDAYIDNQAKYYFF